MDGAFSSISHSTDTNVSNWWLLICATTGAENRRIAEAGKALLANPGTAPALSDQDQTSLLSSLLLIS